MIRPVFLDALLRAQVPLVAEVKRRDAEGRDLLGGRSVPDVVAGHLDLGVTCLSVVTGRWFGGTPAMLREVVETSGVPVLQKDFLTRRSQLDAAARDGAAAVLLTAQLLPTAALATLVDHALELGLTPFVEVVSSTEVQTVPRAQECIIAVNNKDIGDRERGPAQWGRSLALLPDVVATGCLCPVSASGIDSPATARRLLDAGFRGLLVGTSLLTGGDVEGWRGVGTWATTSSS